MNLYNKLREAFSFENKSIKELIEIGALVDAGKKHSGALISDEGELAQIASVIVALINERSTADVGIKLYENINELIVAQNLELANASNGKKLYEKLMRKQGVGKYTVQRHGQRYRFILKASSGEVLAVSELYSKIESCLNGIEAVRKNSSGEIEDHTQGSVSRVSHPKYELYVDRFGEYRFRLKAKNGEVIVVSEGYKNKQSCLEAIDSVKKNAVSDCVEKA